MSDIPGVFGDVLGYAISDALVNLIAMIAEFL